MNILRAALLCCLLAACERQEHEPGNGSAASEAPAPAPSDNEAAVTSIIRPEVAEEVNAVGPSAPPEQPLRAIVPFPDSGDTLDDAARAAIDAMLADPRFAGAGMMQVVGHSDTSGSDDQNLRMSRRRAEAVRDYLLSKGVQSERISVVAMGERRPLAPNAHPDGSDYPEGRKRNRRVEIVIAPPPPSLSETPGDESRMQQR